jgi:transcriptional regulator with XRE-family HTH domain
MQIGLIFEGLRIKAGLSRKQVARHAGVSLSTVSRVEEGNMDPTISMAQRLFSTVGVHLEISISDIPQYSIAHLHSALQGDLIEFDLDWTQIRIFVDRMCNEPHLITTAIADAPARTNNEKFDALIAGIAEKLADDHEINRPAWCSAVPPSSERWASTGTPTMMKRNESQAAPQFIARNIYINQWQLWREKWWEQRK